MRLSYVGVIPKTGSKTPCKARNCVSAKRTSSRATSISLLFSSARLIASFNVSVSVLSLVTPKRVVLGIGGKGRCSTFGKTGSACSCVGSSVVVGLAVGSAGGVGCAVAGVTGCGVTVCGVTVDGGACGGTCCDSGGAVGEVFWPCGAVGVGISVPGS